MFTVAVVEAEAEAESVYGFIREKLFAVVHKNKSTEVYS